MAYMPPQPWHQWDAQTWNHQLLWFCFVADADAPPNQFLRASEEDLPEVTGGHKSESRTMAERLVQAVNQQAQLRNGLAADFALKYQMKNYTPLAVEEPPFFAFLWLTCLISHGYPDSNRMLKFHGSYKAVFGQRENLTLKYLPEAWQKLSKWLAIEGLFEGRRHRKLELPPMDNYRRNISHSWWLSFPSLADSRLLEQLLNRLQEPHGWNLKASSPKLISSLSDEAEKFSPDFKKKLKELEKNSDAETGFSLFLDRVIQNLKPIASSTTASTRQAAGSDQVFGPLVLCSYGDVLGVLLLADGIPELERDGWHKEPGHDWCEKLNEHHLLVPNNAEDPQYAAFESGSIAIDREEGSSSIPVLVPDRGLHPGLLPFGLDPDLHCPRLLLDPSAEQKPSHVMIFEENAENFLRQFHGKKIDDFDLNEEGWVCIRDFEATPRQLKTFAISGASPDGEDLPPKLTFRKGLRVQGGFLARGLGLPSVHVQFRQPAQAVELFTSQEKSPIAYTLEQDNTSIWIPSGDSRREIAFQPGAARLVASFADSHNQEKNLHLEHISSHVRTRCSQTITFREDWGCKLGPIHLETLEQSSDFDLDDVSKSQARKLLSNEDQKVEVDLRFEQQMLDALCAVFQRRRSIKRRDFRRLYRLLGGMSSEWPLFHEGLLRAWCEGGWLEEGMDRHGQWNLQPIDPRLVQTSSTEAQAIGLLSVAGLERLLSLCHALEMEVRPVAPACPWLPRGWRFCGGVDLLSEFSGLPLVGQEDWVELPMNLDWVVVRKRCDGPNWPCSARDPYLEERLCGVRKGSHLDYSQPPEQRFQHDHKASPDQAVIHREHGFGRTRWHSPDDGHGRFVSCHRNRAALHSIHGATNGLWPFGFPDRQRPLIERFYDADAYLPLPIGRFAALKGPQLPGPTLSTTPEQHTYAYWLDQDTGAKIRDLDQDDVLLPLINLV